MKLSVAMCTYNGARYVQEQLASIALQTRPPDELIVCDDRSSDETRELIEVFARRSSFPVRLSVNEKTLGPVQNFAQAIGLCRGELIFLADQDDVWHAQKLARVEHVFDSRAEVGLVFTDAAMVDMSLQPLGYRAWQCAGVEFGPEEQRLFDRGRAIDVLLTRNVVTGATIAFRSSFKELILPIPDESAWMLHDYWVAALIAAVSNLTYIDEPMVSYRRHPRQHTGLPAPARAASPATGKPADAFHQAYPVKHELLRLIYERLSERNSDGVYRLALRKLAHLRARAEFRQDTFVVRACKALRELFTLRYHLYSGGLRSAARDISVPHKFLQLSALVAGSQAARPRDKQS